MYSAVLGRAQPAARAAASAMAHWRFCGTPCSARSQRRTAFWSSGSIPDAWTSATHSSSVLPVRSASDPLTALIISSGVFAMSPSLGVCRPDAWRRGRAAWILLGFAPGRPSRVHLVSHCGQTGISGHGPAGGRETMSQDDRGNLRIYLGNAAGVGKTYDMLCEGHRRAERGADVVVGFVETHGREHTAELVEGLEVVPRARIAYRGTTFEEMDLDAVLARRPQIALVDELAHTNVPGSRNPKRWQDVEELLDAGIDVISTVNIQHLESLNDVVEKITGVPQRETLP